MKKKILIITFFAIVASVGLGIGNTEIALAQNPGNDALILLSQTGISETAPEAAGERLPIIIGKLIQSALGLIGIVLIALMLYAGFMWMTAAGNPEKVEKAKSTITRAIIGAVIIFTAYAITGFVLNAIINAGK